MPVPPPLVRRAVLAPLVLVLDAVLLVASPVLGLLAALASPFAAARRALRLLGIVVVYAFRHAAATLACLGLGILCSGRRQRVHYAVLRWFVGGVYRAVVRLARVDVRISGSADAEAALATGRRPVIVLSRHAGEGDSLLIIHELLCRYRRRPRVVLHEALQLDPLIDLLGQRLPNRFVDPRGGDTEVEIAAMARGLGAADAVLIFPEGGNFSPERRQRSIERLERAGHAEEAAWAREMRHVSAPRPGGVLAAIDAAPDADVVVIGHTGVPEGFGELWRLLPHPQSVELRLWLHPARDIPAGRDERIDWLFGAWLELDRWVDATG
jgi:1-acyl-sn-glycerol-3-phosphate acyltransferase